MAKDDMHEISYKILKYIHACDKGHEVFDAKRIQPGSDLIPEVPNSYLNQIFGELAMNGYLTGVIVRQFNDIDRPFVMVMEPHITLAGEEFMLENSLMKKVGETFKNAIGVLSFLKP